MCICCTSTTHDQNHTFTHCPVQFDAAHRDTGSSSLVVYSFCTEWFHFKQWVRQDNKLHIDTHAHTNTHMHTHTCTRTDTHSHTWGHTYTQIHRHTHVHTHGHMRTHIHTHTHTDTTDKNTLTHIQICTHWQTQTHTDKQQQHTHSHTHTHTPGGRVETNYSAVSNQKSNVLCTEWMSHWFVAPSVRALDKSLGRASGWSLEWQIISEWQIVLQQGLSFKWSHLSNVWQL